MLQFTTGLPVSFASWGGDHIAKHGSASKAFQVDLTTNKPPARSRSSTPKLVDKRSPQPKLRTTLFEACSQYLQLFRVFGLPALTVRTLNSTCILGVVLGVD